MNLWCLRARKDVVCRTASGCAPVQGFVI